MKNLFVVLCLFVSSAAFASDQEAQKNISDLKCTGSVQKSMIASVAQLVPLKGYGNSVGVVWEWQQFIAWATNDGRLAVSVGDSRFGSFGTVKKFKISFTTEWPTKENKFSYSYSHPGVEDTYNLTCVVK